jgi:cation:H+ antiporter
MFIVWSQFAACVALIWVAGTRLSRYGDVIAEKTGLGRTWIGLILLATVTSLPELATGLSAVTLAKAPDIAVGDALGSCVFNLMIVTLLDFLQREESLFTRASQGHILSAGFGVILIGLVGFSLSIQRTWPGLSIGHAGVSTPIIVLLYAVAMRTVFRYERRQRAAAVEEAAERYGDITLRRAVAGYSTCALAVVATGVLLPFVGERLATIMGWQQTFVGTLFVAFATSVPEVVVTIAAVRLDALDLAVSNLLGSNLFDVAIIAIDDLCFVRGPLLAHVSPMHTVSSLSALMMTGVTIVGLLYRPPSRLFRAVGWSSLLLFALYLLNTYVLYLYRG